jgi:hypothetical protein
MPPAKTLAEYLRDKRTKLPPRLDARQAAEQIAALHEAEGGVTFNLHFGNQAGQRLFAVSVFPERTRRVPSQQISVELLRAFIQNNTDLLADPRCGVGTWFDPELGLTFIDVTATVPRKTVAVRLGKRYNQIAIFDLERCEVIEIGGSGQPVTNAPPLSQRLPAIRRGPSRRV